MPNTEELQQQINELKQKLRNLNQQVEDMPAPFGKRFTNALVSSNFSSGKSGWRIQENGDVEFNDGTFRGDLIVGTVGGQRVEILNSGNTLDFYDEDGVKQITMRAVGVNGPEGVNAFILETTDGVGFEYLFSSAGFAIPGGTFDGDIEVLKTAGSLILKSPDAARWKILVANDGTLSTTAL